ncbi:hypothetical protein GE09DRAFT_1282501 [Coniochaeta sp. 2T2.1]|nr:hypothetical protein GE09DRAFT_1282501 [Coniochaeta sp. 2T2.1]
MTNFSTLPAELWLKIMGELSQLLPSRRAECQDRGLYAAVSREWQAFFEPLCFAHLELDEVRGTHLTDLDPQRQSLVKKISLCYHDISRRDHDEFWEEPMNDLFGALGTWEPGRWVELELRLECPYCPEFGRILGDGETMEVTCQPDMDGVKREIWKQCAPFHTRWW